MLPRLRFIVAALAIAVLPWLVIGTGAAMRGHDAAPAAEFSSSRGSLLREAMIAANDAQQLQIFAYARRSEELNRLRELASAPLPNWIAAPAGEATVETAAKSEPAAEPQRNDDPPASFPPQPDPEPAPTVEAPAVTASLPDAALPTPSMEEQPVIDPPPPSEAVVVDPPPLAEAVVVDPPAAEEPAVVYQVEIERIPMPVAKPRQRKVSAARQRNRLASGAQIGRPARSAPADADISNPFSGLFNLP